MNQQITPVCSNKHAKGTGTDERGLLNRKKNPKLAVGVFHLVPAAFIRQGAQMVNGEDSQSIPQCDAGVCMVLIMDVKHGLCGTALKACCSREGRPPAWGIIKTGENTSPHYLSYEISHYCTTVMTFEGFT